MEKQRVESIHLLRAVAALMVVFFHSCNAVKGIHGWGVFSIGNTELPRVGAAGVDIFFIISGFVMIMTLGNPEHRKRGGLQFFIRRSIRVLPLYWIGTTAMVMLCLMPGAFKGHPLTLPRVVQSYLFIPAYSPIGRLEPILIVGWTLFYEMFFYTIIAACIAQSLRSTITACSAILGAIVTAGLIFHPVSAPLKFFSEPIILEFVMGMLAGALYLQNKKRSLAAVYGLIALALVLWGLSLRMPMQDPWRVLIWGLPAWALVLAATSYESRNPVRLWRPLTVIADASYSIYIFHIFIALFLEIAVKRLPAHLFPNAVVVMALCFAGCLAIGIAGHYLIEKPVTTYLNGLQKRQPRAAVPQPVAPVEPQEFMGAEASGLA